MLSKLIELQHRLDQQMDQVTAVQRSAAKQVQQLNDDILAYLDDDFGDDPWEGEYPSYSIH